MFRAISLMAVLAVLGFQPAGAAGLGDSVEFDIRAQKLSTALLEFSKQAGVQVLTATEIVADVDAPEVKGKMVPAEAMGKLLTGTKLQFHAVGGNAIAIERSGEGKEARTGGARGMRVVEAESGDVVTSSSGQDSVGNLDGTKLDEIVVTAQKRTERLQDVPVPVSAISADALVDSNQLRLQDYFSRIPGLNVTVNDLGASQVTIRGLTTGGYTNPTVAIVIDDVPFGSSSLAGYGELAPEVDPSDLARIEVLRGPQGTLYGASSLGGLLKIVTIDPSTDRLGGRLQAGVSSVYNGAALGHSLRGAINVPLSDTFAIRASGFTRQDPGYIDDPVLSIDGLNEARASGGLLSALWRPSEQVSLKVSALAQRVKGDGSSDVYRQPGLGDLEQSVVRGAGAYDKKIQAYAATLTAELGRIDLAAISGYNVNDYSHSNDSYTPGFRSLTEPQFGVTGTPLIGRWRTNKFTQELRLSGPIGQRVEWLLGAFYGREHTQGSDDLVAADFATGIPAGVWAQFTGENTITDTAVFAGLTVHITDRFDVQIGGRESQNRQSATSGIIGPFVPLFLGVASPLIQPELRAKENSFTYLVTPRFKVSSNLMLYARLASGYRPGGSDPYSPTGSYGADTTNNYEIGVKGDVLDRALSFDASLYYIDWKDVQLQLTDPIRAVTYRTNGSRAKSQGVELSAEARPLTGLSIAAWVTWNDAVLTEDFPPGPALGLSGDRLPYGSRFSGTFSVDQEFPLTVGATGFVGGSVSYIGEREGVFTSSTQRQIFPAYAKTDLRAGARYDSWTVNLFVNNVADKRGLIGGGFGSFNPIAFIYIQPRTVGLSLSKTF